eukprot:GHVU01056200.1.p1 GENE.GHVU01056200.1~~GHVU01056200.1.p1  ORF type:complete len:120 (+),score=2.03 GHVU01056200.1:438-797(+)
MPTGRMNGWMQDRRLSWSSFCPNHPTTGSDPRVLVRLRVAYLRCGHPGASVYFISAKSFALVLRSSLARPDKTGRSVEAANTAARCRKRIHADRVPGKPEHAGESPQETTWIDRPSRGK